VKSSPLDTIEQALAEIDTARKKVIKGKSKQITQADALDYLKSVAYSWFRTHRPALENVLPATSLSSIDGHLQRVLEATSKASSRTTYAACLKDAKNALGALRSHSLTPSITTENSYIAPPDFSALAADSMMQEILVRRWDECQKCIKADAHLAATIMMGGFLEALFVARANRLQSKEPLFRSKSAPMDYKTKKPLPLSAWTLRPYIEVGHELGWISRSGKDVAEVLRDYRNYVHPEKERSHGVTLNRHDSSMFWNVTTSLVQQLLESGAAAP
jgi:hypothetical protein